MSDPVELDTVMGLAARILTLGPMVLRMLRIMVIHSVNVFCVCLHFYLFGGERSVPLKDHRIDWDERCDLMVLLMLC